MTLNRVLSSIPFTLNSEDKSLIEKARLKIEVFLPKLRKHRNKRLGHNDIITIMGNNDLPYFTVTEFNCTVDAIELIWTLVLSRVLGNNIDLDNLNDTENLIRNLRRGEKYWEAIKQGNLTDANPSEIV